MQESYKLFEEVPEPEVYRALRVAAGLSPKSAEAAEAGLPNTLFAAVVRHEGSVIGMGRVIGDGGCFFVITDMAVEPAHQGRGVGKAIFGALVRWLHGNVPAGGHVSLLADGEARRLYAQFGFRPTAPHSIGMVLSIR